MDILGIVVAVLVVLAIGYSWTTHRAVNELEQNLEDLRQAMQAMTFINIEEVDDPTSDGVIYLAFDLKSNRFMGQDFSLRGLYRTMFERKPDLQMLWVHTKDTGDTMIRVDREDIIVDIAAA